MPAIDNDTNHPGPPSPPAGNASATPEPRSESLLPAGDDDADGRFAVAEEVSLDQQSDEARRIGALPPDPGPGADLSAALAGALAGADDGQSAQHASPQPQDGKRTAPPAPDGRARPRS